jgi:hypothetical protein
MEKYKTKMDVCHYLWQKLESDAKKDVQYSPNMKMGDWISEKLSYITAGYFAKSFGRDSFLFEATYCIVEPDRSTVKWINGEHALLYDQYLCEKHGILIMTRDDYLNYHDGQTVFCPKCNEDKLRKDKSFPFEYQEIEDRKMVKIFSDLGRKNRLHNRIDNFVYRTNYKIKITFQKLFYSLKIKKAKNEN